LIWNYQSGVGKVLRVALELKVGSVVSEALICEGLQQTAGYMDLCGADEGHLVIFDCNPNRTWEKKIWRRAEAHAGGTVQIWGM
jgi:hypothetical protein